MRERIFYRHSGRIDAARFVPRAAAALGIAVALGVALQLASALIGRLPVVPLIPGGLALGAAVAWAINAGHCRSRLAAYSLALAVALTTLAAQYQTSLVQHEGFAAAARFDRLPGHVQHRLIHDVIGPDSLLVPPKPVNPRLYAANALFLALDAATAVGLCLYFAHGALTRPFCEQTRSWMRQEIAIVPPGAARELAERFADGRPDLAECRGVVAYHNAPPFGRLRVFYGRDDDGRLSTVVHFEAIEQTYLGFRYNKTVLPVTRLSPDEFHAVAAYFPSLNALTIPPGDERVPPGRERLAPLRSEFVTLLDDPVHFDERAIAWASFVVGINNALLAVCFVALMSFINARFLVAGIAFAVMLLGLAFQAPLLLRLDASWRRGLHEKIRARVDRVVDPDDPAIFWTYHLPRENWTEPGPRESLDSGLAKIDAEGRRLLFEGDRARWTVPFDAIESCFPEALAKPLIKRADENPYEQRYVATLRYVRDGHTFETPLGVQHGGLARHGRSYDRVAAFAFALSEAITAGDQPRRGRAEPV